MRHVQDSNSSSTPVWPRSCCPEFPALRLQIDEHHHHKDVYEHTLTVLDQAIEFEQARNSGAAPDLTLRLAALLHDIGKPLTSALEPGGVVTFHHHDVVGAKLAAQAPEGAPLRQRDGRDVARLIELHLRFFGYTEGAWTDSAVRRYVRDAGASSSGCTSSPARTCTTRNQRKADRLAFAYDDLEERIATLAREEELAAVRPDLDGRQIMEILGIRPGREVGEAYRFLLDLRLDARPARPEEATARACAPGGPSR